MTVPVKRSLLMSTAILTILLDGVFPWWVWELASMISLFWLAGYAYRARADFWISVFGFAAVIYSPVRAGYLIPIVSILDWYYFPVRLAVIAVLAVSWFTLDLPDEFEDKWGGVPKN